MNSYPHPVVEYMFNDRTNETMIIWFCSSRLLKLIIKKTNNGSWCRQYISLADIPWHTFRLRLVGTDGLVVMSIDNRR